MPVLRRGSLDDPQYHSVRPPDTEMRGRLRELAEERRRWGYRMLHVLLERKGHAVNHKRVYRLYREEGLQVRRRRRRKRAVRPRRTLEIPTAPSQRWSMDFVHDELATGRRLRCLTVVDDFTREAVAIHVAHSIPGEHVAQVRDRAGRERGLPAAIVCGPMSAGSSSLSSGRASRWRTPSPRASTARSGRSA